MFWIDSATQCVERIELEGPDGGTLGRRTSVVRCPEAGRSVHGAVGGVPDGMTIDAAGHLWVVLGESGCVVQYDATSGRQLVAVRLPVERPTSCAFGARVRALLCRTSLGSARSSGRSRLVVTTAAAARVRRRSRPEHAVRHHAS